MKCEARPLLYSGVMRVLSMVVLCIGVGCSSSQTGDAGLHYTDELAPEKISASYGAFSDGKSLSVYVAYVGDGFLRVKGNDSIVVDVNGNVVPAPEVIEDTKVHYEPVVTPAPDGATVTISFRRGDTSVVSKRALAPNFEIVSPPATFHAGDALSIDVSPRPDAAKFQGPLGPTLFHSIEVSGTCVDTGYQKFDNLGSTYPIAWDTKTLKLTGTDGCDVDVKIRIDSVAAPLESHGMNLQGGGFEAAQYRTFRAKLTR
jgi:hypothetical protein